MLTFNEVFNNPKTQTRNPKLLLERTGNPSLTLKQAREYLDKNSAVQVTTTHKINKKLFSKIVAYYPNQQVYMDFINYDRFSYNMYKYIFCYVDTYSRFAVAIPMKTRNHETLKPIIERIFNEYGIPKKIFCDNEFRGGILTKLYEKNNIKMFFSHPDELHKNSIVERFNGTLAKKIQLYRTSTKDNNWPKYLQDIVDNYNDSEHSSTKMKPIDVFNWKAFPLPPVFNENIKPILLLDDTVRILNKNAIFKKGDELRWSRDLYKIYKLAGSKYKVLNLATNQKSNKKYALYELKKITNTPEGIINTDTQVKVDKDIKKSEKVTKQELKNIDFENKQILMPREKREVKKPAKYLV